METTHEYNRNGLASLISSFRYHQNYGEVFKILLHFALRYATGSV